MATNTPENLRSDISPQSCDETSQGPFSDLELHLISQEIPRHHWEELGLRLGFTGVQLQYIHVNNKHESPQRAIYDMLLQWRQNQPTERDQRDVLLQALLDTHLKEVAESITDGAMTSPSLELDVEQLRKELIQYYLSDMCKIKFIPWDDESYVDLQKFYVRLSLVLQDTNIILNRPKTFRPLQDSHDGIFSPAASQTSNSRLPMRLLLEGEAGMGKTTLIAKLAYDWATQADTSPLTEVPLFLALPFRKWKAEWTIGNAVYECLLASDSTITARQIDHYIKSNPDAAKVALEGYDEAKFSITDTKASGRIGRILRNEELRECQVLVTTRPWRVEDFKGFLRTYTRIEIEGFHKEETEKYVQLFFQGQDEKAGHVLKYICEHPVVSGFLSGIPLFTAMLCELTNEVQTTVDDLDEFNTLSDLFRYFTSYLWGHYDTKSNFARSSPEESEKALTKLLLHLGRVGLDGLFSPDKKLLFDSSDFRIAEEEGDEKSYDQDVEDLACKVGILSKHRRQIQVKTKIRQRTISKSHAVSFFHKLSQEYCAGVYLAHLAKTNETAFNWYLRQICSRTQLLEFKNVLLFTCGEGTQSARLILDQLASLQEKWVYVWVTNDNPLEIALLCNLECKSDGQLNTHLKRFLKSSSLDMFVSPFKHEPHISVAYKYLLSSGKSLPMENCNLSISKEKDIHIFFDFMSSKNATSLTGLKLNVSNLEEESYVRLLKCLQSYNHLCRLSLLVSKATNITQLDKALYSCVYPSVRDLKLQSESMDSLAEYLALACDRFPNIEDLTIDKASVGNGSQVGKQNKHLGSLKTLTITNLACGDQSMSALLNAISQACPNLTEFNVSVEDKDVNIEIHDKVEIMAQLRCLNLTVNIAKRFPSDELMTFIASYAPLLKVLRLDARLSYGSAVTHADIPMSAINDTVECATFKHACESEEDLLQVLLYFPNVKSLKTTYCEPFRQCNGQMTADMIATNTEKLEVNCSAIELLKSIVPNRFVIMNSLQNSEITTLSFLSSFHSLRSLSLINLPFKTLNLGGCPKMPNVRHLQVHGFFLQCVRGLRTFFNNFPHLISCQVPFSVNDAIIDDLSESLRGRNDLRLLVVGIDAGVKENVGKMVEAIASLHSLEYLVFRMSSLHSTLLHTLAQALPVWSKLTFLGIHSYQMKDQTEPVALEAMGVLADACAIHDPLLTVDLSLLKLTKEATLKALGAASPGQFSLRLTGPHLPCDSEVYTAVDMGRDNGYVTLVSPDNEVRYGEFHGGVGPSIGMDMCGVSYQAPAKDVTYWKSVGCPDIDALFGDNDNLIIDDEKEYINAIASPLQ